MSRFLRLSLVGVFPFALACYHATVDTGLKPSAQVVEKSFAAGWIFGLVPPSTVATASQCSHGAAKIETQLSFVNQLVAFLTLDIFTPRVRLANSADHRCRSGRNTGTDSRRH